MADADEVRMIEAPVRQYWDRVLEKEVRASRVSGEQHIEEGFGSSRRQRNTRDASVDEQHVDAPMRSLYPIDERHGGLGVTSIRNDGLHVGHRLARGLNCSRIG